MIQAMLLTPLRKYARTFGLVLLAAIIAASASIPAAAQQRVEFPKDGNGLLDVCTVMIDVADTTKPFPQMDQSALADKIQKLSWCMAYLQATQDILVTREINLAIISMMGVRLEGPDKEKLYAFDMLRGACIPEGVSILQLARVLVKWLKDHPARLHEPRAILVGDAFKDAFPCQPAPAKADSAAPNQPSK